MPFVNTIACVRPPTVATIARCCKRFYLVGLCMLLIAMLLGTATWAIINFSATRALIPLIAVIILLSMVEGALVLAILQATNNKLLNDESHELPTLLSHSGPPKPSLIHPAFRDSNKNSPRNFPLPRERCLDITTPDNAPAIPVPDPYAATGMILRDSQTHRPLPPLPVKSAEAPAPPTHLEKVNDVTVLPLRIQKREIASVDTAVMRLCDAVEVESVESAAPKSGDFDKTPGHPHSMSEAEKIITGVGAERYHEQDDQENTEPAESKPLEHLVTEHQVPQTPIHLAAPVIMIQQPTPTTPKSNEYPAATLPNTPTIRLVSQYLEIPTKIGHGTRRKK
ncbi:uncharacterized protein M437DRAFT_88431 [Aureobasidium melanogenum CBS 110374]|uniref:Uncharacterized protein n=1 Tax=Aureobasidium melanogenum (strain CBS 110374) TaxID=1043003 RepID=A0A074W7Z3_AURM1|nr:uncharacterized protein M437DRAFT_88431 [Aureobasidium melanogenum CBS 110374]KEQ58661.1 hypothetical protein M437DRAFT_88431 [Aureobasidium melanogenum CBS 110374]